MVANYERLLQEELLSNIEGMARGIDMRLIPRYLTDYEEIINYLTRLVQSKFRD